MATPCTVQESHSHVLPDRLGAKRTGASEIEGHDDRRETEGREGDGRRVPPPEVPAHEATGGVAERPEAWPGGTPGGSPEAPAAEAPGEQAPAGRPASKAAAPGQPFYLPQADWRWPAAVAGLVLAAAPQALLDILDQFAGSSSSTTDKVTAASAVVIAVSSFVIYSWDAFAAWLFSLRTAGRSLALWGFRRPTRAYFWVVPLGLFAVYVFSYAHDSLVHPRQQAIVSDFPHSALGVAMFVLVAVVMAPVFEEILFRGFLFRGLANSLGWVWGAVISASVFGAAHLQPDVFLPLAVLGFILAWAYHRTGSLWTTITMHALFNAIAVVAWVLTS